MELRSIRAVCLGLFVLASHAWGQVYLVTGDPDPKGAGPSSSDLWRVEGGGTLKAAGQIVQGVSALFWMEASEDNHRLIALTRGSYSGLFNGGENSMVVVDFDAGEIVKRCPIDYPGFENWLADLPGDGLALISHYAPEKPRDEVLRAVLANPSLPCESSHKTVSSKGITAMILNEPSVGGNEMVVFGLKPDGRMQKGMFSGDPVYLDYPIPEELRAGIEHPNLFVIINNPRVLAVILSAGANKESRLLVFRKSDGAWHRVATRAGTSPFSARSLGNDLVFQETHPDGDGPVDGFTGRFDLYNLDTENIFTVDTRQNDSEALLIEGSMLYYRVADRLFSAPITDSAIGDAELIATAENIRMAHWAFIKH